MGLFLIGSSYNANASVVDGSGGSTSASQASVMWYEINGTHGTRTAWNELMKRLPNGINEASATNIINRNNQGFKLPNGKYESMSDSCKRSSVIWYYGHEEGKRPFTDYLGNTWHSKDWYLAGKNTNSIYVPWHKDTLRSIESRHTWNTYKKLKNNWSGGKVIIVCDGSFNTQVDVKRNITITADSKKADYNGSYHEVTTDKLTGGALSKGHKIITTTKTREKNEGVYSVPVRGAKVVDKNGKNVSSDYKISTVPGKLTIAGKPVPSIEKDDGITAQCISNRWEVSVKGATWVDIVANAGFNVSTAERFQSQSVAGINTQLGDYANSKSFFELKTIDDWNKWAGDFNSIKNNGNGRTPTLTLTDSNQKVLSKYGGVVNATRRYRDTELSVQTCQPQEREWTSVKEYRTDENGKKYLFKDESKWSPWKDKGVRKVIDHNKKSSKGADLHYQILSVNCNIDQFNAAQKASGLATKVHYIGDGSGSAMMETESTSNRNALPFGKTNSGNAALNRTGTKSFYTDGTSCDVFVCSADKLEGSQNDAKNNIGENPLFTQVENEDKENTGKTINDSAIGKDYLIFFRDNKDRNVRADVWYPKNHDANGLKIDSKSAADRTFAKVAKGGTPELEITHIASSSDKNKKFSEVNKVYNMSGGVNEFVMKSQWASDESKPHELGINWQYLADAKNVMPTKLDGYEITSFKKDSGSNNEFNYKFAVNCEYKNDKNAQNKATIADQPFASGNTVSKDRFPSIGKNAIRALFTRSVSDVD